MKIGGEIQVWIVKGEQAARVVGQVERLLDVNELEKATQFLRPELRSRYVLRRAMVREILGRYLGALPSEVRFEIGPFGKPSLARVHGSELEFSLSHSADFVAVAVCLGRRVGIDVERIRLIENADRIAEEFFAPPEREAYLKFSEELRNLAFLKMWTCKEAYLKATGDGLSFSLKRFEVSVSLAGEGPQLLRVEGKPEETKRWAMMELPENSEFVGAIAVEGAARPMELFDFNFG